MLCLHHGDVGTKRARNALCFAHRESQIRITVQSHVSFPKLRTELKLQDRLYSMETRYIVAYLTAPYLCLFNDAVSLFNDVALLFIERR